MADYWSFVLTDVAGNAYGEVQDAQSKKLTVALNGPSTANFTIRPDNALFKYLYSGDTYLQVWRNSTTAANTLYFHGPVVSPNLQTTDVGTPTCQVNAADMAWVLSKRLAGKSGAGTTYTTTQKGEIAKKLIEAANSDHATGIEFSVGAGEYAVGGSATYTAGPYKPVLSCITDLAQSTAGFDWIIEPYWSRTERSIRSYFKVKEVWGWTKANAGLEYNVGRNNVRNVGFIRDLGQVCNRAYHILEGKTAVKAEDATSIAYRGLFEEVADSPSLEDTTLREQWVAEVVNFRRNPRNIVSFTLDHQDGTGRVPDIQGYGDSEKADGLWLGDIIPTRYDLQDGTRLFEGEVRIYRIEIDVDNNGMATITPILVDEGGLTF